jgi:FkbM family methyltransferase
MNIQMNMSMCEPVIVNSPIYQQSIKSYIDFIFGEAIVKNKAWEFDILKEIADHIIDNTDFIDVGANIGLTTLGAKQLLKNSYQKKIRKYHCFECDPNIFQCLQYNTSFHDDIDNYMFALSNQIGFCYMNSLIGNLACNYVSNMNNQTNIHNSKLINDKNGNACYTMDEMTEKKERIKIAMLRLDDIKDTFENRVSVIKIDVEGFEKQVLEGATEFLQIHQPVIIIEIWDQHFEEMKTYLESIGYNLSKKLDDENYIFYPN